jgi:hypothetical protein
MTQQRRDGLATDIEGQLVDSAVAANTVIIQFPPARSAIDGDTVGLLLSQKPAPACKPDQLLVKVNGIQQGGGGDFDSFEISDTSASACTLVDQLRVVGLDAAGRSETNTLTWTPEAQFVLTADTPPRTAGGDSIGQTRADLLLQGAIFYGPNADGSCTGLWVTPATWSITASGTTRVLPNGDGTPQTTFTARQGYLFPDPTTPLYPTP